METIPPTCPLNIEQIMACLPHRYPFLLIDRISELQLGDAPRVVAYKNITISDQVFQGHFPTTPVYPGVLLVEGIAQSAGVLARHVLGAYQRVLLTEIQQARFRRPVIPGDTVVYDVTAKKTRAPFFWFEGIVKVDGEIVASAAISALVK